MNNNSKQFRQLRVITGSELDVADCVRLADHVIACETAFIKASISENYDTE